MDNIELTKHLQTLIENPPQNNIEEILKNQICDLEKVVLHLKQSNLELVKKVNDLEEEKFKLRMQS